MGRLGLSWGCPGGVLGRFRPSRSALRRIPSRERGEAKIIEKPMVFDGFSPPRDSSGESPGASGSPFLDSKTTSVAVFQNTVFSPTGSCPGTFGGVSCSLVLPSRAAWVPFFFPYMVRSTLPPDWVFDLSGWGRSGKTGPVTIQRFHHHF